MSLAVTTRMTIDCSSASSPSRRRALVTSANVRCGHLLPTSSSLSTRKGRSAPLVAAGRRPPMEGDRVGDDEDPDLYIGTYSTFWTDPEQLKGVAIFCAFLLSFFSLGNIGAALILPILYGTDQNLGDFCLQSLLFGYYCN